MDVTRAGEPPAGAGYDGDGGAPWAVADPGVAAAEGAIFCLDCMDNFCKQLDWGEVLPENNLP